jgi:hypothetical protein
MQVMHTPSFVFSHLQTPMVMLQQHSIMPFIMQQQLHMVPAMAAHRFCNMLAAILSSHEQVIFMPPVHFSIFILQRGTIIMFMAGALVGICAPMPGIIAGMPGTD